MDECAWEHSWPKIRALVSLALSGIPASSGRAVAVGHQAVPTAAISKSVSEQTTECSATARDGALTECPFVFSEDPAQRTLRTFLETSW